MIITKFEDEEGNLLYETKDNVDATVTVSNDKLEEFKNEISQLENNLLYNSEEEKKTTIDLASKYMAEGQAMSYTTDDQGNVRNLTFGSAPLYQTHQLGVRIIGGVGPAFTIAGGGIWDSKGNIGLYGSVGGGTGYDQSLGFEYINSTSYSSDFNIRSLKSTSADNNFSAGLPVIGLDISTGGNAINDKLFTKTGSNYNTHAIGVSISASPVAATRTIEFMGVLKLFNFR